MLAHRENADGGNHVDRSSLAATYPPAFIEFPPSSNPTSMSAGASTSSSSSLLDGQSSFPLPDGGSNGATINDAAQHNEWQQSFLCPPEDDSSSLSRLSEHAFNGIDWPRPNIDDCSLDSSLSELHPTLGRGSDDCTYATFDYPIESAKFRTAHSSLDLAYLDLIDLLDSMGCPRYAFDAVVKWASQAAASGCDFQSSAAVTRETFTCRLQKRFKAPVSQTTRIALETDAFSDPSMYSPGINDVVNVVSFNLKDIVLDLLSDVDLFGNLNNLAVDVDNPFGPYRSTDARLDEINSGLCYQMAWDGLDMGKHDFLLPIIAFIDKTGIDGNQRHGVDPCLITTTILNRKTRNLPFAWRHLGFINDLEKGSSAQKARNRSGKYRRVSFLEPVVPSVCTPVCSYPVIFAGNINLCMCHVTIGPISTQLPSNLESYL